jgi:hypothetical protein
MTKRASTLIYFVELKYKQKNVSTSSFEIALVAASRNYSRIAIENFVVPIHDSLIKLQSAARY